MTKKDNKTSFNPVNERMKYKYRIHLRRINQRDEKTIIAALKHIREYEIQTNFEGFQKYNGDKADTYIRSLFQRNLSMSFISDNIRCVKEFLQWLERQKGYRSKIDYNQIDYLNISRNQQNTAKAVEYQKSYTYDQIIKAIRSMPNKTDKERRDKAIISLNALCALRISELRSIKIKNLIEEEGQYFVSVCPKTMDVKFAKSRIAYFIALPDDIIKNVIDWVDHLKKLGFQDKDPLFPVIDNRFGQANLLEQSIRKTGIQSDTTIRDIFKKAFERVGFAYIKPHSFRKTISRYAERQSPAFLNAIRQNLGHKSIDTTLNSYGQLSMAEQKSIIAGVKLSGTPQAKTEGK